MSRYRIPHPDPALEVIVGWDNPIQTFFVQVFDPRLPEDDNECVYWQGTETQALPTLEALCAVLPAGVTLPADTAQRLQADWQARTPPTPLQRWAQYLEGHKEDRMVCHTTDVCALAQTVYTLLRALGDRNPRLPIAWVHVSLQGEPAEAGGGHMHYTLCADTSYGSNPEALALVNQALPTTVYCLQYDAERYEDACEAFDDTLTDIWE